MIGQQKILDEIKLLRLSGFPHFVLLIGERGAGKKMIAKHIANTISAEFVVAGNKVDNVREVIELSYKRTEPALYLFADADKMSVAAKNALLKITEEPPKNAYFVLTAETAASIPQTLISRSTCLMLNPYGIKDLVQYQESIGQFLSLSDKSWLVLVATTPGQINEFVASCSIEQMQTFVRTVVDNIAVVSGANAFKIPLQLKLKEEGTGYDPLFFLRAVSAELGVRFMECCKRGAAEEADRIKLCMRETIKYEHQLKIVGISKAPTIDMWILAMRGILVD